MDLSPLAAQDVGMDRQKCSPAPKAIACRCVGRRRRPADPGFDRPARFDRRRPTPSAGFAASAGPRADGAHQRRQLGAGHRLGQPGPVPRRARLVGDHAGQADRRLELGESLDRGRQAAGRAVGIDDQNDRGAEQQGDFGGAAFQRRRRRPVEQAHDAFDHGQVGVRGGPGEELPHVVAGSHPGVEVVAGPARSPRQVGGIEEIGADLEGLHAQALAAERADQADRQRSLADAAAGSGDYQPGTRGRLLWIHAGALHSCHR